MEEPLHSHLQRQDNQIGNLMGMLMELKEKLENVVEKKNLEKESAWSEKASQKKWSQNKGTLPHSTVRRARRRIAEYGRKGGSIKSRSTGQGAQDYGRSWWVPPH